MKHQVFGKLTYKGEFWRGHAVLPAFAAVGQRPEDEPLTDAQAEELAAGMMQAIDHMKDRMREQFGEAALSAFESLMQELDESVPDDDQAEPEHLAREQKRIARQQKRAARLARGEFPFRIMDPEREGPAEQQIAAFRHLVTSTDAVLKAVTDAVFDSFQNLSSQDDWGIIGDLKSAKSPDELAGQYAIERAEILREHHNGIAYVVFPLDASWEDEHGLVVVYHPDKPAVWTSYDGIYDLIESDEPLNPQRAPVSSPAMALFHAIWANEEAETQRLIAAGADLNDLPAGAYPPLWIAVDQMDPEAIRRLLHYGADPNARSPDGKTPLEHARKLYRDVGFAPSRKKDKLTELLHAVSGPGLAEVRVKLEEIIGILESATGK